MANLNGFDANTIDPTVPFEPLPAGKYVAAITKSELKPTKDGTGSYLEFEMAVTEGPLVGRKVWDRLCINHPNELTQKIARGSLSAICRAVGVMQPSDSVELHNKPMLVTVGCKKREDNGEMTNEVKGYERKASAIGQQPPSTPPTNAAPQTSQPVNQEVAPWAQ